jgi:hypothetical protein
MSEAGDVIEPAGEGEDESTGVVEVVTAVVEAAGESGGRAFSAATDMALKPKRYSPIAAMALTRLLDESIP